jgi:hypothetical protein
MDIIFTDWAHVRLLHLADRVMERLWQFVIAPFENLSVLVFNLLVLVVALFDKGNKLFLARGHQARDVVLAHGEQLRKFCFLVEILISVVLRDCAKLTEGAIKLNIRNIK